jgi:biotin-dependent carboxylase-like uncharacterized protein
MIEVLKPGLLTTVQDLGRPGYAHLGVARSGALDEPALRLANRLVGNPDDAAALETTLTGATLRAGASVAVAVTGAPCELTVDGQAVPLHTTVDLPAGSMLQIGPATAGVRSYVAFAGGIDVPPVLGSRATDTLSGLGPPPLRAGATLSLRPAEPSGSEMEPLAGATEEPSTWDSLVLRVRWGPRQDWFSVPARDALLGTAYRLSVKSNRVGARLQGESLTRANAGELPSEGLTLGAVQVPADGQPLVFLADHPTTGGYPVIAVVDEADLPLLAQARPGATVSFSLLARETRENSRPWT